MDIVTSQYHAMKFETPRNELAHIETSLSLTPKRCIWLTLNRVTHQLSNSALAIAVIFLTIILSPSEGRHAVEEDERLLISGQ